MSTEALDAKEVAEAAIRSIGLGYDLTNDLNLKFCKRNSSDPRLIAIDDEQVRTVDLPDGISIPNVPISIQCDEGDRIRLCSDVLSFQQMSEQFNQELSLSCKIPSGHFNAAFEFSGAWQKDAAYTKSLAFDGEFITLYNIAIEKTQVVLRDHVKQAVPSSWDPAALARFVEKYGTHVLVGVKIGGTDIIYAKQQYSSPLEPADVQKKLKDMAEKLFINESEQYNTNGGKLNQKEKFMKENVMGLMDISSIPYSLVEFQDIKFMCKRKGGSGSRYLTQTEWCQTVLLQPDVISMSFIPITSFLSGINGSGFLTHAINLYLRYKPPIEKLHQFLEFQLPRQWAPIFGEVALGPDRRPQSTASLLFSFMGPKLHINTTPVDVGKKPVTGLRLYLEGNKSNCLAIHLQHLSSLPRSFQLDQPNWNASDPALERKYYEKVQGKSFSHLCSAPVESGEDNFVVTGARFEIGDKNLKRILFLRLTFAKVVGANCVQCPQWDASPRLTQKSGMISNLISTHFSSAQKPPHRPTDINISSALYLGGPPVPTQTPKLLRFVDTMEITRGPQDPPGYWVVSGARLCVEYGKISLRVKYSLLTVFPPEEEATSY